MSPRPIRPSRKASRCGVKKRGNSPRGVIIGLERLIWRTRSSPPDTNNYSGDLPQWAFCADRNLPDVRRPGRNDRALPAGARVATDARLSAGEGANVVARTSAGDETIADDGTTMGARTSAKGAGHTKMEDSENPIVKGPFRPVRPYPS